MTAPTVTSLLQGFFTERLARQLQASPKTVSAYRDTIRLLLLFAATEDEEAPVPAHDRRPRTPSPSARSSTTSTTNAHNSTATRNARLAAIHSFYHYALPLIPDRAHTASQVLAIPQRRHDRAIVSLPDRPRDRRPPGGAGPQRPGTGAGTTLCSSPPFRQDFASRR